METDNEIRAQIISHMKAQFGLPQEQLEAMIPTFIKTLHEHIVELEKAVVGENLEHIGRAAHTIKGALLNLGLNECAHMTLTIEQDAKAAATQTDYKALLDKVKLQLCGLFE